MRTIAYYDVETILSLIVSLTWVITVGVLLFASFEKVPKLKSNKQIIVLFFSSWAFASIVLSGMRIDAYLDGRNGLKESLSQQSNTQYYGF